METMFNVLLKTDGAEWEWILSTKEADDLWRYLGQPDRVSIDAVAVAHGQIESGDL